MNPTKEELDKAIEYYEDMLNQNVPLDMEERTALTILTRYRDGELVLERTRKAESNVSKLEAEIKALREAAQNLVTAIEQRSFFQEGYRNGSASISEVMAAGDVEVKAYEAMGKLLTKNEGL